MMEQRTHCYYCLHYARAKMCEKYDNKWAFQYPAVVWDKWSKDLDRMWCMEKELEVLE